MAESLYDRWQEYRQERPCVTAARRPDVGWWGQPIPDVVGDPMTWRWFPTWREAYDWVCSELLKAEEARLAHRAGLRSVR